MNRLLPNALRWPRLTLLFVALLVSITINGRAHAETLESVVNPKRANNTWVSDMARVLDSSTEQRLNALLNNLERETGAEMAVVTIRSTDGATPKQFATRLFNRWGIGKKSSDNGVLMLLVLDARRIEVETGNGMSSILPAGEVQDVLQQQVIPRFKQNDYPGGVVAGVRTLVQKIKAADTDATPGKYATPASGQTSIDSSDPFAGVVEAPSDSGSGQPSSGLVPLIGGAALLPIGGLAWMKLRPRHCPRCQGKMRKMSESEDDAALAFDQRFEESIGSVDYHVWHCDNCNMNTVERANKWFSGYDDCPHCRHRTLQSQTTIVRHPTYHSTGLSLVTRTCRFPNCNFRDQQEHILPIKTRSTSSSSSGSSGSSSSGSFGGGSSSGGGAGASW